jgi:hypothetical protein
MILIANCRRPTSLRLGRWLSCLTALAVSGIPVTKGADEGESTDNTPMAKVLSEAELAAEWERLALERDKVAGAITLTTPPPPIAKPPSLLEGSAILCFEGKLTLIPKRAVLFAPESYADRMKSDAAAKIVNWEDFFPSNRGWITTFEVTQQQVEGVTPIPTGSFEQMSKDGNLVVATLDGNPVTVLPLVKPAVAEDASKQKTTEK